VTTETMNIEATRECQLTIDAAAHGGHGVGRLDGKAIFIPGAVPGDVVRATITRELKNMAWGSILEVVTPSPDRTPAEEFDAEGAHSWLHFKYPAQGEWKRRIVADSLLRLGGVDVKVGWEEDPALRLGYRTRATFHGDGTKLGYYAPGTHEILDRNACPLCHPNLNAVLAKLHDVRLKGSCTVTVNPEGDEVLVWTSFPMRRLKQMFQRGADYPGEDSGRAEFVFDGRPIVNGTFSQSSLLLNRMLVKRVEQSVGKAATVLDLYCGNGNLSLGLSKKTTVLGLDHNRFATRAADRMRKGSYRNGGEREMENAINHKGHEVIILDPPRSGAKALAPALASSKARKLVYVSCDPATLARDVRVLLGGGWQVKEVTALDMFPNTAHVETVCVLERG
jgi:23S rRNA (uracil1939-C5)-methyltransferase